MPLVSCWLGAFHDASYTCEHPCTENFPNSHQILWDKILHIHEIIIKISFHNIRVDGVTRNRWQCSKVAFSNLVILSASFICTPGDVRFGK